MAYTATVTKQDVSKVRDSLYSISISMVVNDGVEDIFRADATQLYSSGDTDLSGLRDRLLLELRKKWDKYAAEQNLFTAPAFDSMVATIEASANTYINQ